MNLKKTIHVFGISFLLAILASPSFAHTELISSNPQADSVVTKLPKQLTLTFSEPPLEAGSVVKIEQSDSAVSAKLSGQVNGSKINFDWPDSIHSGKVIVHWRAVADDGHVVSGAYKFFYQTKFVSVSPSPTTTSGAEHLQPVTIGGLVMLLVLALGILAVTRRGR